MVHPPTFTGGPAAPPAPVSPVPVPQGIPAPVMAAARAERPEHTEIRALAGEVSKRRNQWLAAQRAAARDAGEAEPTETAEREQRNLFLEQVVNTWCEASVHKGRVVDAGLRQWVRDAVDAEEMGLGRLQLLLADPRIEEVHIVGADSVRVTYTDGTIDEHAEPVADSDDDLVALLRVAAKRFGASERQLSAAKPKLKMQLPDGTRMSVMGPWIAHRPTVTLRRHNTLNVTLDQLRDATGPYQTIDRHLRDFLAASMAAGLNIMVAGLQGAGKTTVLRALAEQIPSSEPFVVLEETRELFLHGPRRPWVTSWETREGHGDLGPDGKPIGEVGLSSLIPSSLTMGTQRIIVGEVLDAEIVAMLKAMVTSRGSLCTIHARNANEVGPRIIQLIGEHTTMSDQRAAGMAAGSLDLIVFVTLEVLEGRKWRYVSHVRAVDGATEGQLITTDVFAPGPDGRAQAKHHPPPVIAGPLAEVGYTRAHFDAARTSGGVWSAAKPARAMDWGSKS